MQWREGWVGWKEPLKPVLHSRGVRQREVMDLRPYEGFGPFRFGMTREEVRELLGAEPSNTNPAGRYSHRLDETLETAHVYHGEGMNVQFGDDDGLVNWIVSFHFGLPIIIEGVTVAKSWRRAVKALDGAGAQLTNCPEMRSVWSSEPFGFWLQKGDRNTVWSVAAHARGEA